MKRITALLFNSLFAFWLLPVAAASAEIPETIHYQGQVTVAGEAFDGEGDFKFALVDDGTENEQTAQATAEVNGGFVTAVTVEDPGNGYLRTPSVTISGGNGSGAKAKAAVADGQVVSIEVTSAGSGYSETPDVVVEEPPEATMVTLWSHDASSQAGSEPAGSVSLPVHDGIFSVALGGKGMEALAPALFETSPVNLRIWFDGGSGFQQLAPDQPLTSVPYALRAKSVADGAIAGDQIDSGIGLWSNNGGAFSTSSNVGIGTSSPSQALEIDGNIEVSGWMGTASSASLEMRVANEPVVRIDSQELNDDLLPNVTIGAPSNQVMGSTTRGTIISGGHGNTAKRSYSTIGGGQNNETDGLGSTVSGGYSNRASGSRSTVGGGDENVASGTYSTVGGGELNNATGFLAVVGGGDMNTASGSRSTVGGGLENTASGTASTVPGGIDNVAGGTTSFAAGRHATTTHDGTFVWSDGSSSEFASTGSDQFLIEADGGVGINTNNPETALHVLGDTAIGEFAHDHRLGVGTSNPWNTLHVVSNEDQGPFRVAVGSNSNTAFRVYPNRGAGIGASWGDDNVPSRGLRVHGETHLDGRAGIKTTDPIGGLHIKDSLVLEEPGDYWTDAWRLLSNTGHLRVYHRDDVNSGSFDQVAYVNKDNGSWNTVSDERLKTDVTYLDDVLPKVLSLKPATYRMKDAGDDSTREFGFLAQEVQAVFPDLISDMGDGYLGLEYSEFAALSIQAIREQQQIIDSQAAEITELRSRVERVEKLEERLAGLERSIHETLASEESE